MATFVLVHGSWHGAWCWYKIIPRLRAAGHTATAVDLPGHGRRWDIAKTVTLQDYVDAVLQVLDGHQEPVILVGHSRGGIVISQTAEERPEKIKALVYLAAFLIPDGEAMLPIALSDRGSLIVGNLTLNEDDGWHMLKAEAVREALYEDCSEQDAALASLLLTPEPNAPVATPLHLTQERFGKVPRVYIETRKDKGVTPALQGRMYKRLACEKVIHMDTGHSPFLSAPEQLARHLISLA